MLDLLLESTPTKGASLIAVCRRILHNTRVREVMAKEVVTVHPETPLVVAARTLKLRRFSRLPVVDEENRLVGIVARSDFASDLSPAPAHSRGSLRPGPSKRHARGGSTDLYGDI
jgi:CBS-domain-containing membrane protein